MNPKKNPVVTRGPWGFSSTSGTGIDGAILHVHRFPRPANMTAAGWRPLMMRGQLDGMRVTGGYDERNAKLDALGLEYGYLARYGRNTCKFVMSRAARRRGFTTNDYGYAAGQRRHAK